MRAFYRMDAELIITQVKQLNRQMQRFSNPPLLCHVNKYDLHQLKRCAKFTQILKDHNLFEFCVFLQWLYCTTVSARVGELMGVCLFVFLISPNLHHTYSCTVVPARRVGGVFHL